MSIRIRLIAVLATMSLLALVALTAVFMIGNVLSDTERAAAAMHRTVADAQRRLERALTDEAAAVRLFVLTGDERALAPYLAALDVEAAALSVLGSDPRLPEPLHRAASVVGQAADTWHSAAAQPAIRAVKESLSGAARSTSALDTDRERFDAVRAALDQLDFEIDLTFGTTHPVVDLLAMIQVGAYAGSVLGGLLALILTIRALGSLVWQPLQSLVATARQVEGGADVSFQLHRRDEVGDLAAALERMRHRINAGRQIADASAEQASIVNAFTEMSAFTTSDVEIAEAMLTAIGELVGPDASVAHVSNRSRDRATPVAATGEQTGETLSLHGLEACPGVRRGSLYVTPDVGRPLAVRCPVQRADHGTVVCVPLTALGETVGAIHLWWDGTDALPIAARTTISRLAEHTALSIGNRRLVNALQGMANTDARTGLPNSRSFDEAVEAALGRVEPGRTDAVLMLDLDHFKSFNDKFGHPGGDEALRSFGGILRASIRDGDLVARYGGEEFAVFLPGVDPTGAREIAERIRVRTEETTIVVGPGTSAKISVSIGIALSPVDGTDRLALLKAADQALYRAKQSGRNRIAGPASSDMISAKPDVERRTA